MTDTAKSQEVTPQKQRELYKAIGYKSQRVGEIWYPISTKWYKSWVEYTAYHKKDEDIDEGVENLHLRDVPRPGPIDNSELAEPEDPIQLKKDLEEHLTHEWLHSEQWNLLRSWYGCELEFPRQVYERGSAYMREKYIAMYPKFLKFAEVNADGAYDVSKVTVRSYPEQYTLLQVVTKLEDPANDEEKPTPSIHLWVPFEHIKKIYPVTTPRQVIVTLEDLKDEDSNRYVEIPDDHLMTTLNDVLLPKDVVILVERKRTDTPSDSDTASSEDAKFAWPLVKGPNKWKEFQAGDVLDAQDDQRKWYEAYIRCVGKEGTNNAGKVAVHFIGWNSKWDEWIPVGNYERLGLRHSHVTKPHRQQKSQSSDTGSYGYSSFSSWYRDEHESGAPNQKGVVGLRNLGNTCFMNSTIQCLAQSPYLTDYFLRGDYVHHINHYNPLGWKGKVAQSWAQLLKDMFSNKYQTLAPREFKAAIGEVAPRFMGYSQQDSQELLSFLLDGLHEDLNQIREKPNTETVESNGRSDEVVAAESWRTYLKRNVSIIVDLLQGQYKSRVECPDCGRVSITFDPYMFLSVPLPTEKYKLVEFTWVGNDPNVPPTVYGVKMLKLGDVEMLKKAIAKQFNVPYEQLFVCDIWKGKIHRELKDRDMVMEFNPRNDDIVVYYAPRSDSSNETTSEEKDKVKDEDNDKEKNKKNEKNQNSYEDNEHNTSRHYDSDDDSDRFRIGGMRDKQQKQATPDYHVFHVLCQTRVRSSRFFGIQQREEEELIGMPFLINLPLKRDVSHQEARQRIFQFIKPYLTHKDKWNSENDQTLPFSFNYIYGYNSMTPLEDRNDPLPLRERGFKFVLEFSDRTEYNEEICIREKRARDNSAPSTSRGMNEGDRGEKAIMLTECIDAFTEEETLDENDAWYCSKCTTFKCAKKKIDLWSSPDLLIIHLKRFSYTKQWRDRINTLVKFPLEGLDISPWIASQDNKKDAIYDLYGISNHMGSLGGGHYNAYAKNLDNEKWYNLDDSHTSPVRNPESMVSSAAYVLYYKRRRPRQLQQRASRVIIPGFESTDENTSQGNQLTSEN